MEKNLLEEIFLGWKNFVFKNKENELIAKKRISHCIKCKHFTKRKFCDLCNCYMPAKVRYDKSVCKLNIW